MKSFKQFNEAGYTDRYAHRSVENDNGNNVYYKK